MASKAGNKNSNWKSSRIEMDPFAFANSEALRFLVLLKIAKTKYCNFVEQNGYYKNE